MKIFKNRFRKIKKFPSWLFWFPATFLRISKLLMRTKMIDPNEYMKNATETVFLAWHNRVLFIPPMIPKNQRKLTSCFVSPSRDGQYISDLIGQFGIKSLRGSSSKRGMVALHQGIKLIEDKQNVFFTPDGPRGPKYKISKGPIQLASKTGVKIVPTAMNASSYWEIKSWDRFQIPKPWAKLTFVVGDAITIPPNLEGEEFEKYRQIVEDALMSVTKD